MLVTSLHAAEGTERRPVRRAWWPVPAEEPSRDTPVPPLRFAVRRGEGAVGGALRAPVRVLAGLRRRTGAAVPGLRAFRERFRPGAVPGVPGGVPARLFVQDAGAVPVVRCQAGGGHRSPALRGGVGGGRPRAVGLRDAEDAAAVLSAPPGSAWRACARGLGDGSRADGGCNGGGGPAAGDGGRGADRGRSGVRKC
jgi:hypothetical protein